MSELIWEDPPAGSRGGRNGWAHVVAELREHAGKWAIIAVKDNNGAATSLAATIRSGATAAWAPKGAFQATSRGGTVYARYCG